MTALRLYLLRHGEPTDRHVFYGHRDVELSPAGIEQARAQARILEAVSIAAVHSSDLHRAAFGARLIAETRGLPVHRDPAFREMHLGDLEGIAHADALTLHPELAARSYHDMLDFRMPGGGESVRDVVARVLPPLLALIEAQREAVLGGQRRAVVLYAHNTVNRIVLAHAAGAEAPGYVRFAQRYGALSRIDFDFARATGPLRPDDPWQVATIAFSNFDPTRSIEG